MGDLAASHGERRSQRVKLSCKIQNSNYHAREDVFYRTHTNQLLLTAYYLKEELRLFWDKPTKGTAKRFLEGWLRRARASGIKILITMANTLESRMDGLLAWYDYRTSSGPMDGTNNKIKTMKRQAYGYRDMEFFELKILSIHETRYALVR